MRSVFLLLLAVAFVAGETVPNYKNGRTVVVHLFEWTWGAIADECERFLGPYGFAGVQISPPMKNNIVNNPPRPWYERYQPVSYAIEGRSGDETAFMNMIDRCRNVGVLIYVDAVINHMMAGSYVYPEVPYSSNDFNVPRGKCPSASGEVDNYNDADNVRNCDLVGLDDILFGSETTFWTNNKVADYMNKMIDMGVAGFRVDAAKHMWPGDLSDIFGRLHNTIDGGRPYVYQEVIDQGGSEAVKATEYVTIGDVTEFKYCNEITGIGRGTNQAKWYYNFGEAWGMLNTHSAFVFVDNHDNQRSHGGGGDVLTYKEPEPYKKAGAYGMAWDYGTYRMMSSYYFTDSDAGPPHHVDYSIKDPTINPDGTCGNGWVCEHRWRQLRNMACFRNNAGFESVQNWYDNGDNFIAFSRGSKAFFALNQQNYLVSMNIQTGLPSGTYCDVISGDPTGSGCTGTTVHVDAVGRANISINPGEDSMIAIHIGATATSAGGQCNW